MKFDFKTPAWKKPLCDLFPITEQDTDSATSYQDITYYMDDGAKHISQKQHALIDFDAAILQMDEMDWTYEPNFIGFKNHQNNDNIQFVKIGPKYWYCDVPIEDGPNWDGYVWGCTAIFADVINSLDLFFAESSWFDVLPWKMNRVRCGGTC